MHALARSLALAALLAPAPALAVDWSSVADVEEVVVRTADEDGSARETTIWLVVLDGRAYIRTSRRSTWGGNVERDPDVALRLEGRELPVRAHFVTDAALRERIESRFREKYGWFDAAIDWMRGSEPRIMRLDPRS